MALIEHLAQAPDADALPAYLPGAVALLLRALRRLRAGQVAPEALLVAQRLTRAPEKYVNPSPAARAALQLQAAGSAPQPGQRVRFYVYGKPDVWSWDRPEAIDPQRIDLRIYRRWMLHAAADIFQPFVITARDLAERIEGNAMAVPLPFIDQKGLDGAQAASIPKPVPSFPPAPASFPWFSASSPPSPSCGFRIRPMLRPPEPPNLSWLQIPVGRSFISIF